MTNVTTAASGPNAGHIPSLSVEPAEAAELRRLAHETALELERASGSDEMQVIDGIAARAIRAERRSTATLEQLRIRAGQLLCHANAADQVVRDLARLRAALAHFSLADADGPLLERVRRSLRFPHSAASSVEKVARRYEEFATQVGGIEQRLKDARVMLRRDNIELRNLHALAEAEEAGGKREALFAEALSSELEALSERPADALKRECMQTVFRDVSTRLQDALIQREIQQQFYASLELTRLNNARLSEAIDVALDLLSNALALGFLIQAAAEQRKSARGPGQSKGRSREFISESGVTTEQEGVEFDAAYADPGAAMKELRRLYWELVSATGATERGSADSGVEAGERVRRPHA